MMLKMKTETKQVQVQMHLVALLQLCNRRNNYNAIS